MTTKEKVLEELTKNLGNSVSGENLAQICNVSRAAIWKAVKSLREEGCQIEGTTNGGYVLTSNADIITKERILEYISHNYPEYKNSNIQCFKEIDSTNTYAKRLLSECGNLRNVDGSYTEAGKKYDFSIIVAESQTAGRGRLGRTFYSPTRTGIYITIIYAPQGGITKPALATAFAAVAIRRAIKKLFNLDTEIKWINDIFSNGKKLGGILTEGFTNFETGQIESAIVGMGINLMDNPEFLPEEVSKVAGSIISSGGQQKAGRLELASEIACQVFDVYKDDPEKILKEYKEYSMIIGQTVNVYPVIGDESKAYKATAVDINEEAALVVKLEDGTEKTLISGEVTLKSANFTNPQN